MGFTLAQSAYLYAQEAGLDHQPTRLLAWMALTAYDDKRAREQGKAARRFYAGRTHLAIGLGVATADLESANAYYAVRRGLRVLSPVLFRIREGGYGRTAEYELLLNGAVPDAQLVAPSTEAQLIAQLGGISNASWPVDNSPAEPALSAPLGGRLAQEILR